MCHKRVYLQHIPACCCPLMHNGVCVHPQGVRCIPASDVSASEAAFQGVNVTSLAEHPVVRFATCLAILLEITCPNNSYEYVKLQQHTYLCILDEGQGVHIKPTSDARKHGTSWRCLTTPHSPHSCMRTADSWPALVCWGKR